MTIDLLSAEGTVSFEPQQITYKGTGKKAGAESVEWDFTLDLLKEIDPKDSTSRMSDRCIEIVCIKKVKDESYWEKLVTQPNKMTKSWLTTNWTLYVEEEDEDAESNAKLAGYVAIFVAILLFLDA